MVCCYGDIVKSKVDMTGVATRFRQSLSKALSLDKIEQTEDEGMNGDSLLGKSVNFFSKLANNNTATSAERRSKTLLVIDSRENNWEKYFKGRTLHEQMYDIRVEQASLSELQVVSSSEKGASVSMKVIRNGSVVARSFRPDFVLFREYVKGPDMKNNYKNFLLGLMHGVVPAVNSLTSTYNFLEKPVVYSELLKIRQQLDKEEFPLIDQNFYQSYSEMLLPPSLPVVVKVGNGNSGYGKVCVASPRGFQDVASLVSMTNNYATSESFLDGKFDLRIVKIGQRYKVFKRKSLSDAWKTNLGASFVEEIALTERYKNWVDECSNLFGGLDIVCVEAIHTKDDREYIVEVNNVAMSICPDKKDDDMKCIVNLVIKRMEQTFPPAIEVPSKAFRGNTLTDAIQLISGPPSPACSVKTAPNHNVEYDMNSHRSESAPPVEMSESRNTFKKTLNGPENGVDSSSKGVEKGQNRKGSFAGRLFSALES